MLVPITSGQTFLTTDHGTVYTTWPSLGFKGVKVFQMIMDQMDVWEKIAYLKKCDRRDHPSPKSSVVNIKMKT